MSVAEESVKGVQMQLAMAHSDSPPSNCPFFRLQISLFHGDTQILRNSNDQKNSGTLGMS